MALKNIIKEMRDGIGNISRRASERKGSDSGKHSMRRRGRSYIAPEGSSSSSNITIEQSPWANMPPELLHDIIQRIEASQTSWPARRDIVACASVCKPWRAVTKEMVRTPEQCGLLSFPVSLKQPGPRDAPVQCFIRRERPTGTYRLYLGLSPALSGVMSKLLLAARKFRKATNTDFLISLVGDDFSRTSNNYVGKLRSNFLGTKFTIYDSQPPCDTAIHSNSRSQRKIFPKQASSKGSSSNYNVATISYELNVLRTRGPRRMQCTMHSIPISAIQEGGTAPTPVEFTNCCEEQFPPPPSLVSKEKKPLIEFNSSSLSGTLESFQSSGNPLVLKNKAPRWHEQLQCWCLRICNEAKTIKSSDNEKVLKSSVSEAVFNIILQSIFQNTGSEVVKDKDGKTNILGTPTERAILEFGLLLGGDSNVHRQESAIVKVEPFNSVKKKMSVLISLPNNGGFRAFCKGASEIILNMCDKMINADGKAVPISEEQRKNITNVINGFASEALRTLCLAFQDIKGNSKAENIPENNYTLIAVVGIKDPVRPGVREAVETCLAAGITVRMVTGDNIHTAKAIATECGILTDGGLAIEGPDFRNKSPQEMQELIPKLQVMARSSPTDKHILVTQLRNVFKEVVAVTGDGTNDAPALHEADIGLAMGIAGTEVAKENADVIIMDDNFTTIVTVARWGRSVYINIQKFVQFQLTVNIVALIINFVAACITGSAPLTAVQLLWVNMIMDTLGALALATEPPHEGLMQRPPIGRNINFITMTMWRNIIGQSIYQIIVLGVLTFCGNRILKLTGPDATLVRNTFIFNSFVFCQVFNEINSRDMEKINVFRGIFSSWVFIAVMVATVGFQVIIVELLGTFAGTVPLNWKFWLASVVIGAITMPVGVLLKCIPVGTCKPAANAKHHDGYEPLPNGPDLA